MLFKPSEDDLAKVTQKLKSRGRKLLKKDLYEYASQLFKMPDVKSLCCTNNYIIGVILKKVYARTQAGTRSHMPEKYAELDRATIYYQIRENISAEALDLEGKVLGFDENHLPDLKWLTKTMWDLLPTHPMFSQVEDMTGIENSDEEQLGSMKYDRLNAQRMDIKREQDHFKSIKRKLKSEYVVIKQLNRVNSAVRGLTRAAKGNESEIGEVVGKFVRLIAAPRHYHIDVINDCISDITKLVHKAKLEQTDKQLKKKAEQLEMARIKTNMMLVLSQYTEGKALDERFKERLALLDKAFADYQARGELGAFALEEFTDEMAAILKHPRKMYIGDVELPEVEISGIDLNRQAPDIEYDKEDYDFVHAETDEVLNSMKHLARGLVRIAVQEGEENDEEKYEIQLAKVLKDLRNPALHKIRETLSKELHLLIEYEKEVDRIRNKANGVISLLKSYAEKITALSAISALKTSYESINKTYQKVIQAIDDSKLNLTEELNRYALVKTSLLITNTNTESFPAADKIEVAYKKQIRLLLTARSYFCVQVSSLWSIITFVCEQAPANRTTIDTKICELDDGLQYEAAIKYNKEFKLVPVTKTYETYVAERVRKRESYRGEFPQSDDLKESKTKTDHNQLPADDNKNVGPPITVPGKSTAKIPTNPAVKAPSKPKNQAPVKTNVPVVNNSTNQTTGNPKAQPHVEQTRHISAPISNLALNKDVDNSRKEAAEPENLPKFNVVPRKAVISKISTRHIRPTGQATLEQRSKRESVHEKKVDRNLMNEYLTAEEAQKNRADVIKTPAPAQNETAQNTVSNPANPNPRRDVTPKDSVSETSFMIEEEKERIPQGQPKTVSEKMSKVQTGRKNYSEREDSQSEIKSLKNVNVKPDKSNIQMFTSNLKSKPVITSDKKPLALIGPDPSSIKKPLALIGPAPSSIKKPLALIGPAPSSSRKMYTKSKEILFTELTTVGIEKALIVNAMDKMTETQVSGILTQLREFVSVVTAARKQPMNPNNDADLKAAKQKFFLGLDTESRNVMASIIK